MSRFYVTTPIYYVNDVPHIGHAYTTVAGDVLARWRRLWGDDVFYLTGTDEHGLKVQRAAEARGVSPKELVDETAKHFRDTWDSLDIAYDDFIRTTEPRHYKAVQQFLQRIYDAGDIELGTYEGLYCVSCEAYYTEDELVDGLLPDPRPAGRARDRGELLLQAVALRRPVARVLHRASGGRAARIAPQRGTRVHSRGLQDFSMSRTSISWGVPLPWDPKHVAYVWADALFNYCTAVGYGEDDGALQLVVAGRLPPGRQGHPALPRRLLAGDVDVGRVRAAEVRVRARLVARGRREDEQDALEPDRAGRSGRDFGVDGFRYHFMVDQRFGPDGDFSYEAMVQRYNADLANNFGNLANRVLNMAVNYCGGVVPAQRADGPLRDAAAAAFDGLSDAMSRLDFSGGFGAVWDLIRAANAYIEDRQPWALNKAGDTTAVAEVLGDCLEALRIVALLASPVIPRAAGELWRRLGLRGVPEDARLPAAAAWGHLAGGGRSSRRASRCSRARMSNDVVGGLPLPFAACRGRRARRAGARGRRRVDGVCRHRRLDFARGVHACGPAPDGPPDGRFASPRRVEARGRAGNARTARADR